MLERAGATLEWRTVNDNRDVAEMGGDHDMEAIASYRVETG